MTLVSGGMPARLVSGAGLDLVQLPPIRTSGVDFRALLDEAGRPAGPDGSRSGGGSFSTPFGRRSRRSS